MLSQMTFICGKAGSLQGFRTIGGSKSMALYQEYMIKLFFAEVFQCGHSVRFLPECLRFSRFSGGSRREWYFFAIRSSPDGSPILPMKR